MSVQFYPPLSSIMSLEDLPEALSFLQAPLANIFDKVYFRDLQHTKGLKGDSAFYSVTLISYKEIGFEIPGTGLSLVLNPPANNTTVGLTEIPVTLHYEWKVLRFARAFKLENFPYDPVAFFNLVTELLDVPASSVIAEAINAFVGSNDINGYVDDVNAFFGLSLPYPTVGDFATQISAVTTQLEQVTGIPAIALLFPLYVNAASVNEALDNIGKLFKTFLGGQTVGEFVKNLLLPKLDVTIGTGVGLVFPRNVLLPLDDTVGPNYGKPLPSPAQTVLTFDIGAFRFSTEDGIGFDEELLADLPFCGIGNTGLTLEVDQAKLDISREKNIPEATADGRPDDFVGVYIKKAKIGLPPFIKPDAANPNPPTVEIVGRNLLIGTGGLSGTLALETTGPGLCKKFGDSLQACFESFDITFHQNSIVESNIKGKLVIPGFKDSGGINDAEIDIKVHFASDGDFMVTASETQGITLIKIPGIFSVHLTSVFVGREDGRWFIGVSGAIDFDDMGPPIGQFVPDRFDIKKLIIWEDGKIEFEGGKITLPKAISLKIGPVELSVTAIGLGSHEQEYGGVLRQYKYFTFDGGIDTGPGGVDVSGKGITFYYTTDGPPLHFFVRIESIAIDIIIPGDAKPETASLLLKGWLSMKSPEGSGSGQEFAGGIEFTLPKLKMGGSAAMRLNPKVPAWIVDIGLELSSPIVLGSTGLGIYGFRALVGQRYVATKQAVGLADDAPWWQYYKAKVPDTYKEGITVDKFEQKDGFSLGAGVSLATVPDAGKTFSSKLFFLLSLPEVFLLQGQGQILKERIGLDTTTDPPFFALLSISSTSIEAAFGVNYKIPDGGEIATVDGIMEMGFFWGNSSAWYINIGKDQPEDRRIQVRLLTLFNAYFYFMLSSQGIRAGAGASYELKKKFGPLKAELYAYLDTAGRLSFKPVQIGASIQIGGGVSLSIFGFGFSLSAHASLAAEAPKPFIVSGMVKACIRIFRKDRCAKFNFTWTFSNNLDFSEIPLIAANPSDAAKAVNIQTREPYNLYAGTSMPTPAQLTNYYVPADSFIDIEFAKGVLPGPLVTAKYAGNTQGAKYIDYVAPQRGKSDRVRHEYELVHVKIKYHDGATWKDYDVYEAATPLDLAPFVTTDLTTLPFGYWQYLTPNLHNKLRILGQSPIEYVSQGSGDITLEDSNITLESIFCDPDPIEKTCTRFTDLDPGYGRNDNNDFLLPDGELFFHGLALMGITGSDGALTPRPYQNYSHAICYGPESVFEANFIEPMVCVDIHLFAADLDGTVEFLERKDTGQVDASNQPLFIYNVVQSINVASGAGTVASYDNLSRPVDQVRVTTGECKPATTYYPYSYKNYNSNASASTPDSRTTGISAVSGDAEEKLVFRSVSAEPGLSPSALAPDPGGCALTDEAAQLQLFLNFVIGRRQNQVAGFDIWPGDNGAYNGVFYNTVLHGAPASTCKIYATNQYSNSTWCLTIVGCEGFSCEICLTVPPGIVLDWRNVRRLENIRCNPDDNSLGDQTTFLIDAVYFDPVTTLITNIPLLGSSCYPMCACPESCAMYIYEICTLTYPDAAYNATLPSFPAVQDEVQTMINAFEGSLRPIWRFDTPFAIEVKTLDSTYRESSSNLEQPHSNTYYFGFRTSGPPGHFHKYLNPAGTSVIRPDYAQLLAADQEDEFKMAKLLHYIDMPKSYPNADGQLINAKPLFYKAPSLLMFYLQAYVYEFYHGWDDYGGTLTALDIGLEALVKDPAPDPAAAAISPVAASWDLNSLPVISTDVQIINNLIVNGAADPCTPSATISPMAVHTGFTLPDLKPLKLYTAIFNARLKRSTMANFIVREVHRYGFQTSRYGNFNEQVQSFFIKDPDDITAPPLEALFVVEQAFNQVSQVDVAKTIVDPSDPMPNSDPLRQEYGHHFNRLIEGVLQLESIHPPLGTEINVIRNTNNNVNLGILIKNPEPYNDPKIPLADIQPTILMSVNGASTGNNIGLFSKDYSQVFLTNANLSMNIPSGATIRFYFEYKQFNGATYVVVATDSLTIVLP